MNQVEKNQQYTIIAKDNNLIQYEIIMSMNTKQDLLNLVIEPNENFNQKYKAEFDLNSLRNIHNIFQVKSIPNAFNEIVKLIEYNKKYGIENKINFEQQNLVLIIPYAHNFIQFELKKKDLNVGDKFNYFQKIIENLQSQINHMNERIKKLENNVKEYENGKLVFDGEHKDGKRYIGKEYNENGKLIFDGEYKDGKKYKGKKYNERGKLIFEGEYEMETGLEYNGQRKTYNKNDILLFEGEIKEGKIWNGTFYELNGIICGKIINGSGKGKEYGLNNNLLFEGEFKDGKYYKGKKYLPSDGELKGFFYFFGFEGEFKDGKFYKGKEYYYKQKLKFEGEYKNDKYYKGTNYIYEYRLEYLTWEIQYNEGNICFTKNYDEKGRLLFEGTIVTPFKEYEKEKNYLDGKLFNYDDNGDLIFEGQIIKGKTKKGTQYFKANSQMFINNTENSPNSNANEINPEDKIIFEGELRDNLWWTGKFYLINKLGNKTFLSELKEGNGKIKKFWDFEEFEGEMRNGKFWNGVYKKYNIKGKIKFDGEWRDGHKYKGKEYNDEGELIFEGEYDEQNKKYKGKEYEKKYDGNKLIFEGEFKDGIKWNGEIKYPRWIGDFQGEIRKGQKWNGKEETSDFKGEIREGKKWMGYGKGKYGEYAIFKDGKIYNYK